MIKKLLAVFMTSLVLITGIVAGGKWANIDPLTPPMQPGDVLSITPKMAMMVIQDAARGVNGTVYMQSADGKLMLFAKYIPGCQGWGFVVAGDQVGSADLIRKFGGNFTSATNISDLTKFLKDQGWTVISGSQAAWVAISAQLSYGSIMATPFLLPLTPGLIPTEVKIDS